MRSAPVRALTNCTEVFLCTSAFTSSCTPRRSTVRKSLRSLWLKISPLAANMWRMRDAASTSSLLLGLGGRDVCVGAQEGRSGSTRAGVSRRAGATVTTSG